MVQPYRILTSTLALLPLANAAGCGTDNCLQAVKFFPAISGPVSTFCEQYIHSTPRARVASTVTSTTTTTLTGPTTLVSSSTTNIPSTGPLQTSDIYTTTVVLSTTTTYTDACFTTTTVTTGGLATFVNYVSSVPDVDKRAATQLDERAVPSPLSNLINSGCNGKSTPFTARLSSACSCYLGKAAAATATVISTVTVNKPGTTASTLVVFTSVTSVPGSTSTTTIVSTSSSVTTVSTCGPSTTIITKKVFAAVTCGNTYTAVPSQSTSGAMTCASSVPTPSLVAKLRVEGLQSGEGTIFEGCILSGPRVVTTPAGGSHECDGTNNAANPFPGTTPLDMLDAAGRQAGFGYDGPYSSTSQDYIINVISDTAMSGSSEWGFLDNLMYTNPTTGCQFEVSPGEDVQWIFNAQNYNAFLSVEPQTAVAEAGSGSITVRVYQTDGSGASPYPAVGALIAGGATDHNGAVTFAVPSQPGCYQYKAQKNGAAISNAFYLTVYPAGSFGS